MSPTNPRMFLVLAQATLLLCIYICELASTLLAVYYCMYDDKIHVINSCYKLCVSYLKCLCRYNYMIDIFEYLCHAMLL